MKTEFSTTEELRLFIISILLKWINFICPTNAINTKYWITRFPPEIRPGVNITVEEIVDKYDL